ncbi:MAG: hypothetical protein IKU69_06735, partial [Roseburia sp.]|nr:hypothetical protein [Roseburia sp.]
NFDQYIDFVYSLALDQTKSVYPTYTDGIKTKEDFITRAKKSFARENEEILLFEVEGKVEGWIHYYALTEDKCLSFCTFNIDEYAGVAVNEFIRYVSEKYSGFTLQFGLPAVNVAVRTALEQLDFSKVDECHVDVLHFEKYQLQVEATGLKKVTRENYSEFAKLHAHLDEEMYWNTARILEKLDDWHIYVNEPGDEAVGAIYYTYFGSMMEIFGVDYLEARYDANVFRNLLVKALNEGKKHGAGSMVFFNGDEEHDIVAEVGFESIGAYVLYEKVI